MSNNNGSNGGATPTATAPLEQTLRGKRILLTGATGFLGKVFLSLLLRWHPEIERIYLLIRGDQRLSSSRMRREILDSPVFGPLREHLGNRFDRYVEEKLSVLCGDITEDDLISEGEAPGRGAIDAVVHCAGLVNFEASLEKSLSVNTTGVANVIEFCRKRGAALLHVSTCYAAGNADGHRFEDDIPVDWCPNGRRNFTLRREIHDALAAIARVEAESRDQVRQAEISHVDECRPRRRRRPRGGGRALAQALGRRAAQGDRPGTRAPLGMAQHLQLQQESRRAVGVRRAGYHRSHRGASVDHRKRAPRSVPRMEPGRQHQRAADLSFRPRLSLLSGQGRPGTRHHTGRSRGACDDPDSRGAARRPPQTDLPALHFGRESAADAPAGRADRAQQPPRASPRGRSDGPLRAAPRSGGGLAKHLRARQPDAARVAQEGRRRRPHAARRRVRARAKKFEQGVDKFGANTAMARELVEVYRPYIQELVYTFHGANIRALYKSLDGGRRSAPSLRAGPDRLGRLLDKRTSAGIAPAHLRLARSPYPRPSERPGALSHADRIAGSRRRALRLASGAGRTTRLGRAYNDHFPRTARRRASRRPAARDARGQGGRPRAAHRRELARVGIRLFLDPGRRRRRGAAGPSDFGRRAGSHLPHRHAFRGAMFGGRCQSPGRCAARTQRRNRAA